MRSTLLTAQVGSLSRFTKRERQTLPKLSHNGSYPQPIPTMNIHIMASYPIHYADNKGFTLLELLLVIVLISVLSVYLVPRFDLQFFRQQNDVHLLGNALRYARTLAIASQCPVRVRLQNQTLRLRYAGCGHGHVIDPTTGQAYQLSLDAPLSGSSDWVFERTGRPSRGAQHVLLGDATLSIVAETGLVY